ncbi:flagellin N-terminal helical domain-containing protein [Thermaurantiacus sp.]
MFVLVSGRQVASTAAERMVAIDNQIERLEGKIARGERFTEPAEDPAGQLRASALARLDARLLAEQRGIDRAAGRLASAETAVADAGRVLIRARELALLARNGTTSPSDRAVIATEVRGLKEQLLGLANARDEAGRFLFAGARDGLPAYAADAEGRVSFAGFGAGSGAEAAGLEGLSPPSGPALFGTDEDGAFAVLDRLLAALAEPDEELRHESLDAAVAGLVSGHDRLMTGQALIGTAMARLESETERVAAERLEVARGFARVKGLDLAAAISELEALRLTLNAAQEIFQRVHGRSLFDRLG